jgi:hypothetical protein
MRNDLWRKARVLIADASLLHTSTSTLQTLSQNKVTTPLSLILALAGKSACLQRSARGSARNHEFGRERLDDFAALIDRPANNHGNTAIRL